MKSKKTMKQKNKTKNNNKTKQKQQQYIISPVHITSRHAIGQFFLNKILRLESVCGFLTLNSIRRFLYWESRQVSKFLFATNKISTILLNFNSCNLECSTNLHENKSVFVKTT